MNLASSLKERALALGFDLAGIAPASALRDLEFCRTWLDKGYGGEMRYLANPMRMDPRRVLPSVKSIICAGLVYNTAFPYSTDATERGGKIAPPADGNAIALVPSCAWISRYAWGSDYHDVMRGKLEQLRAALGELAPGVETRVFVDTGPVVERAFARLSGIGWTGKNTCLINEQKGSWVFLGVILTNLELAPDVAAPDRCGTCTRCLEACPTGALVEPYLMDASRCISYFNIELRGSIPEQYRSAMGNNVFGCDICQDVCPWNNRSQASDTGEGPTEAEGEARPGIHSSRKRAATSESSEFKPMHVRIGAIEPQAGPASQEEASVPSTREDFSLYNPPLAALAAISEEDFGSIFAHSPIKRTKYRGWLRNLCVAMGNSGDASFIPWLEAAARHADPMVREHACWGLRRLQKNVSGESSI